MEITGLEANVLLYGLDWLCDVDMEGKLTVAFDGYTLEALQDLRDRLFAAHDHPEEDELEAIAAMPDEAIDTSDIPEVRDWSGAVRGKFYRPK